MEFVDKYAITQVIGCLIRSPLLYNEVSQDLSVDDFDSKLTRSIYMAINNLYQQGADKVSVIDIDNYLQSYDGIYANFKNQQGITYLQDCEDVAQLENFDYYFRRVKKFSALRKLHKSGIDVSDIYSDAIEDGKKQQVMLERFDSMTVQDIFDIVNKKVSEIEYQYNIGKNKSTTAVDGIRELKEQLKQRPEIGAPLQGDLFNIITRGARKGKFYLNSGASGSGKSRKLIGNACKLAYPYRYDEKVGTWMVDGSCEKTLIITTELDRDEVQTVIMAYLSGVNEEKILCGTYRGDEEERVDQAIQLMEDNPNLFIEQIADPDINQIKTLIKLHVSVNDVVNVMYDYIFSSPNLLGQFRDLKIRQDSALMMMSTALKDLAVEYNLYIESGTQLSGDYDNWEGVRNQTLIRDSKSIVDKCDMGAITSAAQDKDIVMLSTFLKENGLPTPTHVMDIYKLRRGRYKNVRIWGILDLGTGRWTDLFVTDGKYRPITIDSPRAFMRADGIVDITELATLDAAKGSVAKVESAQSVAREKGGYDFGI